MLNQVQHDMALFGMTWSVWHDMTRSAWLYEMGKILKIRFYRVFGRMMQFRLMSFSLARDCTVSPLIFFLPFG